VAFNTVKNFSREGGGEGSTRTGQWAPDFMPHVFGEHPPQAREEVGSVQPLVIPHKLGLPMVVPGGDAVEAGVCCQQAAGSLEVGEEIGCQLHVILEHTFSGDFKPPLWTLIKISSLFGI